MGLDGPDASVVASSLPMTPVSLPSSEAAGMVGSMVSGCVAGMVAGTVGAAVAVVGAVARVGSEVPLISWGVQPQAVKAERVRTSVRSITHIFFIFKTSIVNEYSASFSGLPIFRQVKNNKSGIREIDIRLSIKLLQFLTEGCIMFPVK
jgi:hypothetical protein